jgi:putative phosphoribosyl transferase
MPNKNKTLFVGRKVAVLELAETLPINKWTRNDWLILSISEIAIFMAHELSQHMNLNIEFNHLFMSPIKAPLNPEISIAMVTEKGTYFENRELIDSFGIKEEFLSSEIKRVYEKEVLPNVYKHRKGKKLEINKQKKILILDDGADTGMTLITAIKTLKERGIEDISIALPIISEDVLNAINPFVKNIFYLKKIQHFIETSYYYEQSQELKDFLLKQSWEKINFFNQ